MAYAFSIYPFVPWECYDKTFENGVKELNSRPKRAFSFLAKGDDAKYQMSPLYVMIFPGFLRLKLRIFIKYHE